MTDNSAYEAALEKALADRQKLDTVISYLCELLGRPVPTGPGSPQGGGGGGRGGLIGRDPVAGVNEAEFFGMSSTVASYEILTRFGDKAHTLKTKQIFDAIKKGGVKISTEEGLYTSLARSNRFRKVARGLWGLSEWYDGPSPNSHRAKPKAGTTVITMTEDEMTEETVDGDRNEVSEEEEVS